MSQAAPERLVANRYALEASIPRQGRAGVVWRAADLVAGGAVAVEEIEPGVESEAECNARWSRIVRGARAAASLDHPGVVRLYDVLLDAGRYFVVTELADALPLDELIDRHGRLPPRRVARIGLEVLDVLDAAHRAGLAHLDLQPAHVLVTPDGAVRLAGLGLAEVLPPSRPAPAPAPEQLRGEPGGPPADLWALGVTMWMAVEGEAPFGDGGAEVLYGSPRPCQHAGPLAGVIEALLDKAPERRPPAPETRRRLYEIAEGVGPLGGDRDPAPASTSTSTPPLIAVVPGPAEAATAALARAPATTGRAGAAVGRAARAGAAAGRAARAQARARLESPGWRRAVDWLLDPRRRGLLVGAGSVLLAVVSFALIVAVIGNPTGSGAQRRSQVPPLPPVTAAPQTSAPATTATTTLPPTTAPAVPSGWTLYADEASGYRIAYPASWEVVRQEERRVEFHDRSVPTMLRVQWQPAPAPDPVAAEQQSSQQHAGFHEGSYRQVGLQPTTFQGRPAAALEFTFLGDDEQPYHAMEIGSSTPAGPGGPGSWVTIFVQSREADWGVAQVLLQTALSSFTSPPT